jgi:hypothetical protein
MKIPQWYGLILHSQLFSYLNSFASHDDELLSSLHQKQSEFMTQDFFKLIGLFDFNRYPDRVD